jgi:Flp pilus assembly protein TadG
VTPRRPRPHVRQRGIAAVELALLLPMLCLLLFGVMDAFRALQANIIMTNIGREGANLVSRGGTGVETGSQDIIYALMASAPPLNVNLQGMVYITRVMGVAGSSGTTSVVMDQYRWDDTVRKLGVNRSGYAPASRVYAGCSGWSNGACTTIASNSRPAVATMSGKLRDGEVVVVVETFYKYDMMLTNFSIAGFSLPTLGPDLYSMTIF